MPWAPPKVGQRKQSIITSIITEGAERGWSDQYLQRQLKAVLPLTERQRTAVTVYRRSLREKNIPPARAKMLVDRYTEKLKGNRAAVIARTERKKLETQVLASTIGELPLEREWVSKKGCCVVCEALTGMRTSTVYGPGLPGPPAHPNCRCSEKVHKTTSRVTSSIYKAFQFTPGVNCAVCGKKLTNPLSKRLGIGPTHTRTQIFKQVEALRTKSPMKYGIADAQRAVQLTNAVRIMYEEGVYKDGKVTFDHKLPKMPKHLKLKPGVEDKANQTTCSARSINAWMRGWGDPDAQKLLYGVSDAVERFSWSYKYDDWHAPAVKQKLDNIISDMWSAADDLDTVEVYLQNVEEKEGDLPPWLEWRDRDLKKASKVAGLEAEWQALVASKIPTPHFTLEGQSYKFNDWATWDGSSWSWTRDTEGADRLSIGKARVVGRIGEDAIKELGLQSPPKQKEYKKYPTLLLVKKGKDDYEVIAIPMPARNAFTFIDIRNPHVRAFGNLPPLPTLEDVIAKDMADYHEWRDGEMRNLPKVRRRTVSTIKATKRKAAAPKQEGRDLARELTDDEMPSRNQLTADIDHLFDTGDIEDLKNESMRMLGMEIGALLDENPEARKETEEWLDTDGYQEVLETLRYFRQFYPEPKLPPVGPYDPDEELRSGGITIFQYADSYDSDRSNRHKVVQAIIESMDTRDMGMVLAQRFMDGWAGNSSHDFAKMVHHRMNERIQIDAAIPDHLKMGPKLVKKKAKINHMLDVLIDAQYTVTQVQLTELGASETDRLKLFRYMRIKLKDEDSFHHVSGLAQSKAVAAAANVTFDPRKRTKPKPTPAQLKLAALKKQHKVLEGKIKVKTAAADKLEEEIEGIEFNDASVDSGAWKKLTGAQRKALAAKIKRWNEMWLAINKMQDQSFKLGDDIYDQEYIAEHSVDRGSGVKQGTGKIHLQPISSFATRPQSNFGNIGFVMDVPRERIFSLSAFGIGCPNEYELTVIGDGDDRAYIREKAGWS